MPNGLNLRIRRARNAGRSAILTTDEQLQTQPGPLRITRLNRSNDMGKIGPNVNTFPMTHGMEFVAALPVVHVAQGVVLPQGTAIDDTVSVPAIFAGNPLP